MSAKKKTTSTLVSLLVIAAIALYQHFGAAPSDPPREAPAKAQNTGSATRSTAQAVWRAGDWLQLDGRVERVLSDDNDDSRHQRFVLRVGDGRTLLVAHNIDLAPRVPLAVGDTVALRGQYEPNDRGGVLHWTHHDPQGYRSGGWVEFRGRRYE